jgi:serine/threonine-protein kinase
LNTFADLTPAAPDDVLEGTYRLVRLISHGGMATVYEAIQLRLNKRVAVKLMSRASASDDKSILRFHREAEITSKLGHPHLVNVIDFGTAQSGRPYLVMEYLEGEDLEQRLQRTVTMPAPTTAAIVVQTASALAAAHAQGVVHRDLKPANIFLLQVPGEPEFVKVLDFGISKIKGGEAMRLTGVQAAVGTPSYMSPEQVTGRADDTDHRADQWALACIAWRMLCGRPPFVADEVTALFYQISRLDPPPLAMPELAGVEEVLRRALARHHTDRYPSMRDFAHAFTHALTGESAGLTPGPVLLPLPAVGNDSRPVPSADARPTAGPSPGQTAMPLANLPASETTGAVVYGWQRLWRSRLVLTLIAAAASLALFAWFRPLPTARPVPAPPPYRPSAQAESPAPPPKITPIPEKPSATGEPARASSSGAYPTAPTTAPTAPTDWPVAGRAPPPHSKPATLAHRKPGKAIGVRPAKRDEPKTVPGKPARRLFEEL